VSTTAAETAPAAAPAPGELPREGLLQRVILPRLGDPMSVRALYVDERTGLRLTTTTALPTDLPVKPVHLTGSTVGGGRRLHATSRTSAVIDADSEVSFGAYFNAFAASYWRRWTTLDKVRLRLDLTGGGRVDVYRTKADGSQIFERSELLNGPGRHQVDMELDLRPFEDGGWYWFDLTTDADELTLHGGGWYADSEPAVPARIAVGMPTFNRPADAVATLTALASEPLVLDAVVAVVVVDQGTQKVRDQAGFEQAAALLGDKLTLIEQPNLGGAGGYARAMHEALDTDFEQLLYMDDDILLEPDSILRALAFSRHARTPTLVGGQMLSLQSRSQLSTMGEVVDRNAFLWRNAPGTEPHHDFAERTLRQTPWLHRRVDVDHNAWWMCMIPRTVVEKIGMPLPVFIKWDDVEYGLRARSAGYRTATVPGIGIWHMSFLEKDDTSDWQAYFHYRNRLVAAALHGPDNPRAILVDIFKRTLRHLMLMEYSAVALQEMALRDFLAGPDELFANIGTILPQIRAKRAEYDDGRPLDSATQVPLSELDSLAAQSFPDPPTGKLPIAKGLVKSVLRNLRPVNPAHREVPQRNVPHRQAQWFVLSQLDSATVTTPDGRSVTFRRRDPELFRSMLRRSFEQLRVIGKRWPQLRAQYRAAQPQLTSREEWVKRVFEKTW
jgi:Predicted glycosyltransferases